MTTELQIQGFLDDFKAKLGIWGVIFRDDRGKNSQALLDLDITRDERIALLKKLVIVDYSEGPLEEKLYGGHDMWVFGKEMKNKELYIKIALGVNGAKVICISFHVAEHKLSYPLKKLGK
jgi:hypothetical protein